LLDEERKRVGSGDVITDCKFITFVTTVSSASEESLRDIYLIGQRKSEGIYLFR